MRRTPPDILITTPESLYLMITSQVREILTGVEAVIVDEIHAVAQSKRGSHLALTLERLSHLVTGEGGDDPQRIGLSATQRPLERIANFLVGPRRKCEIVNAGVRKDLDLEIVVPVEDMTEPGRVPSSASRPRTDGQAAAGHADSPDRIDPGPIESTLDPAANPRSIWPAIYPELLKLVREHTSTIIFVNNRRGAERLAKRLNELHNEQPHEELPATEHDGSGEPSDARLRGDRARAPRLARARGARRGRGAPQIRQAPLPRRHQLARAGHRHGRPRPRDPGRVAQIGLEGSAASGAGRPPAQRGLEGTDLPQVPRGPAGVRRGRQAHARGRDRGDRDPSEPARRARPAPRLDGRRRRVGGRRGPAGGHRDRALLRPLARAARERAGHARRALPVGEVRRAATARGLGPHRRHRPRAQGRAPARGHQRGHHPRPRPVRRPPARREAGRRARRGDGLRGAAGADLPARRDHMADSGDHPRPGDRRPGPRGSGRRAVLAR